MTHFEKIKARYNTMDQKERLIKLRKKYGYGTDDYFADGLLSDGVIVPPCKVGDYIEWDNGICKTLYRVHGFLFNPSDLGMRFVTDIGEPIVTNRYIVRIVPREEAEKIQTEVKEDATRENEEAGE